MPPYAAELIAIIDAALPRLRDLTETDAERRPAPGKWSPKEIIGHLIDSASNNHQRFVRAQGSEDLVFDGYEQDAWVERQGYAAAPWLELLALWASFNRHLARVMTNAPESERLRPRARHNLDRIATYALRPDENGTLEYLMKDYVIHLRRHVRQILPD